MAECSYARCVQQKRNIRRELQRWTKNMVHIVGLERIAEELMGRRKWKLYQESMSRNYLQPLNNNIKRTNISEESEYHHKDKQQQQQQQQQQQTSDPDKEEAKSGVVVVASSEAGKTEINGEDDGKGCAENEERQKENEEKDTERLKDWMPETKCYFCVDGKLDSEHNTHGVSSPRPSESDSSDSLSDHEVPASLTPTSRGLIHNNNHHHHRPIIHHPVTPPTPANMTTIENAMALAMAAFSSGGGATSPGGGALPSAPQLPFYNPVITHNWYLATRSFQTAAAQAAQAAQQDVDKGGGPSGEEPLDLSKGGSSNVHVNNNNNNGSMEQKPSGGNNVRLPTPTMDTKHIFKAKPRMSAVAGRRTYTEDELQAALRDIQSGKLGTRRAAVIYGIPRSTLRNKVYKLALERERESVLNTSTPLEEETMDDEKELSGAEEEKEVEKALQAPLLTLADLFRLAGREQLPDALKSILQKFKEGQDIQHLFLTYQNLLASQKPHEENPSLVPDYMKRIINEEQLLKMQQNNNGESEKLMRPSPSNSVITKVDMPKSESDMETEDSSSNVILKIPSFKPTSSKNGCDIFRGAIEPTGSLISPPITTDSSNSPPALPPKSSLFIKDMKDVIAQSISQKLQQEQPRRPVLDIDFNRGGFTPPLSTGVSVIRTQQELGRQFQQQQQQQPQQPQPHHQQSHQQQQQVAVGKPPGSTGGKGTRPKRGKYRNYDRDSLVEAVRAVQRGEMSVHRAGSYYGVPHSTLEYKVKERHLMRPRKRDPKPNPVDEKIASLKQNDLRNSQDKLKQPMMKPPQKFPPTSPNGIKLPIFEPGMAPLGGYTPAPPPFPFWPHPGFSPIPLDYGRNPTAPFPDLFASQMMQKLQEESSRTLGNPSQTTAPMATSSAATPALAKTARQMAESLLDAPGTSNGSFLDGIIRSSLESGVPTATEQKSPIEEEERNVSTMSNKALLDQLCRNSRLTPLSSKIEAGSSSGDEGGKRSGGSPLNFSTSGASHEENNDDDSLSRYEKDNCSEVQLIELSNDSNISNDRRTEENSDQQRAPLTKQPRIYLKPDLVKPENLKPEMLVRFRDVLPMETDHNGINESSTSDNDAPQD